MLANIVDSSKRLILQWKKGKSDAQDAKTLDQRTKSVAEASVKKVEHDRPKSAPLSTPRNSPPASPRKGTEQKESSRSGSQPKLTVQTPTSFFFRTRARTDIPTSPRTPPPSSIHTPPKAHFLMFAAAVREIRKRPFTPLKVEEDFLTEISLRFARQQSIRKIVALETELFTMSRRKGHILEDKDGEFKWNFMKNKIIELHKLSMQFFKELKPFESDCKEEDTPLSPRKIKSTPNPALEQQKSEVRLKLSNAVKEKYLAEFCSIADSYTELMKIAETRHEKPKSALTLTEAASPRRVRSFLEIEKDQLETIEFIYEAVLKGKPFQGAPFDTEAR